MANNALDALNNETGATIIQWTLLTGTLTGGITIFGSIGAKILEVVAKFKAMASGGAGIVSILSKIGVIAVPTAAILATVAVAGYNIYEAWKEANPTLEEAETQLSDLQAQLQSNKDRLEEINGLSWNEKTSEILAEKDALELQNAELERNIELTKERREEAAIKGAGQTQEIYRETRYRTFGQDTTWSSVEEATEAINEIYGEGSKWADFLIEKLESFNVTVEASGDALNNSLVNVLKDAVEDLNEFGSVTDKNNNILQNNLSVIQEQVENYTTLKDLGYELSDSQQSLVDAFNEYNTVSENAVSHTEWLNDNLVANATSIQSLKSAYPELSSAISESNGVIGINVEQLLSQENQSVEIRKELARLVAELTVFNQTGLDGSQIISSLLQIATAAGVAADSMIYAQQAAAGDSRASAYMLKKYGNVQNWFESLIGQISVDATETSIPKGGGGSSTAKQLTDEALEEFQSYYKDLQHLRDMDEIDEATYLERLRILVDNYTSDATAHMKQYGLTSTQIAQNMYQYEEEIYNGWKDLQEEKTKIAQEEAEKQIEAAKEAQQQIIDDLQEKQSLYETLFGYITDRIQEKIDDLQEEYNKVSDEWDERIDAIKAQNEELEKQITLEEKLDALARAKQTRVLVYKDGRFQYVQNIEEINEAQVALEKYEREQALEQEVENLEKLKDEALASIQDQIDGWEDYKEEWSSVVDHYQDEQDRLLLEQELGIELEGDLWQERLDNLQEYVDEYKSILEQITEAQNKLNQIESGSIIGGTTVGGAVGGGTDYDGEYSGPGWHIDPDKIPDEVPKYDSVYDDPGVVGSDAWYESQGMTPPTNDADRVGSGWTDNDSSSSSSSSSSSIAGSIAGSIASGAIGGSIGSIIGGAISGAISGVLNKHASGTLSTPGGLSLVGENGPELRVLGQREGIISADITKNLMEIGKFSAKDLIGSKQSTYYYSFDKIVLPNVTDYQSFINEIKKFRQLAFQQ